MSETLLLRGHFAAMAAVLIVPELATFLILTGFFLGFLAVLGQFAWSLARVAD